LPLLTLGTTTDDGNPESAGGGGAPGLPSSLGVELYRIMNTFIFYPLNSYAIDPEIRKYYPQTKYAFNTDFFSDLPEY